MDRFNPYQAPESPIESPVEPQRLPAGAYFSATCSAIFVFLGGTFALATGVGLFFPPNNLGALMILASSPLIALALAAVSFWEVLRWEQNKRPRKQAANVDPPSSQE